MHAMIPMHRAVDVVHTITVHYIAKPIFLELVAVGVSQYELTHTTESVYSLYS